MTSNDISEVKMTKREVKTKLLLIELCYLLSAGEYTSSIAKRYGWGKQRINYYMRILRKGNLIEKEFRSSYKKYRLTEEGKKFITECGWGQGVNLHNISYKYEILKEGEGFEWDKIVKLQGWTKFLKKEKDFSIERTPKHIIIHLSKLFSSDPYEAQNKSRTVSDSSIKILRDKGWVLGEAELIKKPHYALVDPVIARFADKVQLSTEESKVDKSEGFGELEYFTPQKANDYIKMPQRVAELEQHLIRQTEIMDRFSKQIELHLQVLQDIRDAVRELREKD